MKNIIKFIIEILLMVTFGLLLFFSIVNSISVKIIVIEDDHIISTRDTSFVDELNSNKSRFITDYRKLRFNNLPCVYDDVENPTKFDIEYPIVVE